MHHFIILPVPGLEHSLQYLWRQLVSHTPSWWRWQLRGHSSQTAPLSVCHSVQSKAHQWTLQTWTVTMNLMSTSHTFNMLFILNSWSCWYHPNISQNRPLFGWNKDNWRCTFPPFLFRFVEFFGFFYFKTKERSCFNINLKQKQPSTVSNEPSSRLFPSHTVSELRDDKTLIFHIADADKIPSFFAALYPSIRPFLKRAMKVETVAVIGNPRVGTKSLLNWHENHKGRGGWVTAIQQWMCDNNNQYCWQVKYFPVLCGGVGGAPSL